MYYHQAKKEHSVGKKIEGILERNDRVLVVDDLITTGESVIEAAEVIRDQGGVVNELVVLLDREQGGSRSFEPLGLNLISCLEYQMQ